MNMAYTSLMVTHEKVTLSVSFTTAISELVYLTIIRLVKSLYFRCHKKSACNFTSLLTGSIPEQ